MKIAVLSRNKNLYSTKRLIEAGEKRGHEMLLLDHMKCVLVIEQNRPHIYFNGKEGGERLTLSIVSISRLFKK